MNYRADHDLTGTIHSLVVYPIKSCAGIAVQQARLTATGLEWDRAWMLATPDGEFLTQREYPRMVLIQPELLATDMRLTAPGMPALHVPYEVDPAQSAQGGSPIRVWKDTVSALDMGDVIAGWFTQFLETPCRLKRFDPNFRRIVDPKWTAGTESITQFADGFPVLVTSTASIEDLNQRLEAKGDAPVDARRFRPNLIIAGVDSHDEDRIESLYIELHSDGGDGGEAQEAELQMSKPCSRCPIPDIDPDTAECSGQVNPMLRSYRQDQRVGGALTFGMNAIALAGEGAVLKVGQRIAGNMRFD